MKEGYNYVPCASIASECDCNTDEIVEYFKNGAPDDQIVGFISAPWVSTTKEQKDKYEKTFKFLKEAKEKFYK